MVFRPDIAPLLRRRRREGGKFVDPLGTGNTLLLTQLGITPVLFYDVRKNLTLAGSNVSALADVSGIGTYGPSLNTSATSPTWDGTYINTNGTSSYLLSASADASLLLNGALACAIVADVSGASGGTAFVEIGGPSRIPRMFFSRQSSGSFFWQALADQSGMTSAATTSATTVAVRLALAQMTSGASPTVSIEVPTNAKAVSSAGATTESSNACNVCLGATVTGIAFGKIKFRALIAWAGTYSTAQRDTLKTWATTYHGATLV